MNCRMWWPHHAASDTCCESSCCWCVMMMMMMVMMLQDVVDSHPGLTFLQDAPEFHSRYVQTVNLYFSRWAGISCGDGLVHCCCLWWYRHKVWEWVDAKVYIGFEAVGVKPGGRPRVMWKASQPFELPVVPSKPSWCPANPQCHGRKWLVQIC